MGTRRKGWSRADAILSRCIDVGSCWEWQGAQDKNGYAVVSVANLKVRGHRYIWEHFNGRIPDGLVLDHLCRNPSCINPWHLDPVTPQENTRRGRVPEVAHGNRRRYAATITHCPQGHAYTGENLRVRDGRRECLSCARTRSRDYWRRKHNVSS